MWFKEDNKGSRVTWYFLRTMRAFGLRAEQNVPLSAVVRGLIVGCYVWRLDSHGAKYLLLYLVLDVTQFHGL